VNSISKSCGGVLLITLTVWMVERNDEGSIKNLLKGSIRKKVGVWLKECRRGRVHSR
jgi:hypothetical protein